MKPVINQEIAALFKELADSYYKLGESQRGTTFSKAATLLKELDVSVDAPGFRITTYNGMGPSVEKELKSFLSSRTSDRLETVRKELTKVAAFKISDAIQFLTSTGIKMNMTLATIAITKAAPKSMQDLVDKANAGFFHDAALTSALKQYKP